MSTIAQPPAPVAACTMQRRLRAQAEPFATFAALCSDRPDTGLFEGKDGRTLLMHRAAVRAECRGESVLLKALSANGESLIASIGRSLARHCERSDGPDSLSLRFPPDRGLDAEARLLALSPLHAIRSLLQLAFPEGEDPFAAIALGVVAFDYSALGEDMPENPEDPLGFPDYVFWIPETLLLFETGAPPRLFCAAFADPDPKRQERNRRDAVVRLGEFVESYDEVKPRAIEPLGRAAPAEVRVDLSDREYADVVLRLKEQIAAGEVYQIVPSRTFSAACPDPLAAYGALRELEPSSYRFFVTGADFVLFGASPETSVRIFRDDGWNSVEVRPIAGTRMRGDSPDEDDRIEAEMRLDHKEVAEHMMLVDLARNDVARISIPGTRRVARLLSVERYARVMHLVSSVTGRLAIGFDACDALAACLNVGTLTGAPKIRATQLLRETERTRRGPYGGAVGWISGAGQMDSAVVIRSALVRDGTAFVRAGAGIVHDSDPMAEAEETRRKASALLYILGEEAR